MRVSTTRITVETDMLTVVRRAKLSVDRCPDCHADVHVVTLSEESLSDPATSAQIQHWLGSSKLHVWRTGVGSAQLCVKSLLECFEWDQAQNLTAPVTKNGSPESE